MASHESTASPNKGFSFGLRNRPWLKAFIAGGIGAVPFGLYRANVQEKIKDLKDPQRVNAPTAEDAFTNRFSRWAQSLSIPGLGKIFDKNSGDEYTQFALGFWTFPVGLIFGRKLLDRWFPDDKPAATPKPPAAETEEKHPHKHSLLRRAGQGVWHPIKGAIDFTLRYPVGCFFALMPYAFMGRLLDATALKPHPVQQRTDLEGLPKAAQELEKAGQHIVTDPWSRLDLRVATMFTTFNLSFMLWNRFVDRMMGKEPATHGTGNLVVDTAKDIRKQAATIVGPVVTGVTPLVATLYFTNDAERQKFDAKLAEKKPADYTAMELVRKSGFEAGRAMNTAARAIADLNVFGFQPFQRAIDLTGMVEKEGMSADERAQIQASRNAVAERMLQFGFGYGAFAALRTRVTPFFKTILGEAAQPAVTQVRTPAPAPTLDPKEVTAPKEAAPPLTPATKTETPALKQTAKETHKAASAHQGDKTITHHSTATQQHAKVPVASAHH